MNSFLLLKRIPAVLLIAVTVLSCTKETDVVGYDLIPPSELLTMGYSDTTAITAYTVTVDSLYTTGLAYAMAGSIYDPVFGKTTAAWYSQLSLSTDKVRFDANSIFDSAFLILPYKAVFGDTLSNMTLKLYEVTEEIGDTMYSNRALAYDALNPLLEHTFVPRPGDSVYYNGSLQAPALRMPLNSRLADKLFTADTTNLYDSTFISFFKGICLTADPQDSPGRGAILMLSASNVGKIEMYYHNDTVTHKYTFYIDPYANRYVHYDHHGYAEAAPVLRQQLEGDTASGSQFLFLQAMAGVKVKLRFPTLESWFSSGKVIVNDAQLVITNAAPSGFVKQPFALQLRPVEADGTQSSSVIIDESDDDGSYYDGNYNAGSGTYRFRISRYVQQLMMGNAKKYGLYLSIPSASITGTRLALNGPASPQSSLKLYIKYTRVE